MQLPRWLKRTYDYIETVPDRLYPFADKVEGKWVRGREAYRQAVDRAWHKYGPHHVGFRLGAYRGVFHLVGSIVCLLTATFIAQTLFNSTIALYVVLAVGMAIITWQEFYLHPRHYGQSKTKGVADWCTWTIPVLIYLAFIWVA